MPLRPDRLPSPSFHGYGYLGGVEVPMMEPLEIPDPISPEDAQRYLEPYQQPIPVSDSMRAQFGAGDRTMVGKLLLAANGQDSGLVGVSPSFASHLLTSWQYPTDPMALDADGWQALLSQHALDANPLSLLGY